MLYNKNDVESNDRIIYKTRPNMLFGCKKVIFGIVLLIIILTVSPMAIKFMGEMQVYLISQIKLSLTKYMAIAFFVIILINVIYIIWQLIGWYSIEYTLTDYKIIIKSGVISTKKNSMPYATIQDINTSQNVLERMFNVGSVSVFSAYDNNQMELKDISNPSEVEEILFSRMVGSRNFQAPPQQMPQYSQRRPDNEYYHNRDYVRHDDYRGRNEYYPGEDYGVHEDYRGRNEYYPGENYVSHDDYLGRNDYYDEYEPITPITHENSSPSREYENFGNTNNKPSSHTYEYEPYDSGFNKSSNTYKKDVRYNKMPEEYSHSNNEYYQNNRPQNYYDESVEEHPHNNQEHIDASSEKVIQRHFDKFKK